MNNKIMKCRNIVKSALKKMKTHGKMLFCAITYGMMQANVMVCYAKKKGSSKGSTSSSKGSTSSETVTTGLTSLKTLIISVIGIIGVIYAAKSVMEFASAYQQSDSSGMNSAAKGIAGGLMMASISTILTFIGIS